MAGSKQLDIYKAAAHVATEVPYDTAQTLFRELTGIPLGSERLHTMVNHVAEGLTVVDVTPSPEEIKRRVTAVAADRWRRPVVVAGHRWRLCADASRQCPSTPRGPTAHAGETSTVAGAVA